MGRCGFLLLIVALRTSGLEQATANTDAIQKEVLQAENQRRDAVLKSDKAALDHLMTDDFKVVVMTGALYDKAAELALYRGDRKTEAWSADEMDIRVYGNTAVVIGRATVKDVLRGQRRDFRFRFTHVWVKRNGRWQIASRQATELK